ncbi:MAG: glycine cleavage T C-terminal barrel domain-containing protein [Candidatus Latescibacterota bacterium]|nr:glycine cleavage T C-terminal barrel domain-containing protein [Candidatus Latescibacterota bacterium]
MAIQPDDNDLAAECRAARTSAALHDTPHWGRLYIRGADHLDFLHRMTTNDFIGLQPGRGLEAVFVEQRARIIDLGVFYRGDECTLLLVSPQSRREIPTWLDRFIFSEAIAFEDITEKTAMLECCGPQAAALTQQVLARDLSRVRTGDLLIPQIDDTLWLARADWDGHPGLRAIGDPPAIAALQEEFTTAGAQSIGEMAWEILRVERGLPLLERELTQDYNPWEAGLGRAIHMDKGCYIGQEVIARLDTYDKIKQHLVGLRLPSGDLPAPGQPLCDARREIGRITSAVHSPTQGPIALAYVHRDACAEGTVLTMGETQATVVPLPFPTA